MSDYSFILPNAMAYCLSASRQFESIEEISICLQTQDCLVHSRFRQSVARDIASLLSAEFGSQILDIKLYGSTMEYTAGKYSDIDMLIQVTHLSHDLLVTLKELSQYLCSEYYRLIGQEADAYAYLLDIHILNTDPNAAHQPSQAYLTYIYHHNSIPLTA